jgi:hypothetical protein
LLIAYLHPFAINTDGVILTVNASQAAMRKENCPGALLPDKGCFLPEMGKSTGNLNPGCGPTDPGFAFKAIDPAISRAEMTAFIKGQKSLHSFFQLAFLFCLKIGGIKFRLAFSYPQKPIRETDRAQQKGDRKRCLEKISSFHLPQYKYSAS